jgi:ATP-dependent exoDNAse (exonuclease V) beta subunit
MNAVPRTLRDDDSRLRAMATLDRSFLVDAGAGSGKTAVLAGRIAMMLAAGIQPKHIAAVTFTELAASELLLRVREFVAALADGEIPSELHIALPRGLSEHQRQHLTGASHQIDDLTCSTIHGFCQRLIQPYPVEAQIDPGAAVMDRDQADLLFIETVESWLREALSHDGGGLLAAMVLQDKSAGESVALVHQILQSLRTYRVLSVAPGRALEPLIRDFDQAANDFAQFMRTAGVDEPETVAIARQFTEMTRTIIGILPLDEPTRLVQLVRLAPHADLCKQDGDFRKYQKKGKWASAAKVIGLSKADGDRLNSAAENHYATCCDTWTRISQAAAAQLLARLLDLLQPAIDRFHQNKRAAALLDFDDLIFAARDLLRDHEPVRQALAARYRHVLVDEFQDTDPRQTEIFWRLCGDPASEAVRADWTQWRIRPGALFLVGDPKQAIYRFRGADVAAYIQARDLMLAQDPNSLLTIATNFRSCEPILRYVNERFAQPLSIANAQPGFTPLDAFHPAPKDGLSVAAIDVRIADAQGNASSEDQRDAEAEGVADVCARLIGKAPILDRKTAEHRLCRPGDIALLAPTGSELWRYEEALESRGIAVASQAGKGLFQRQEIQDLIALTRVLADRRDTLALGALLRGPLVGLTEEELLDIVWSLPPASDSPDNTQSVERKRTGRLGLGVPAASITHPHARNIIEKLQTLARKANATTPYALLCEAVDVLRVRPILLQRYRGQIERALANLDLYLSFSRAFAVRGLRAFAATMTAAWEDESRAVEGRPDAQEEAVALYTMHAAKGLEWPIVIPINTMTRIKSVSGPIVERSTGHFYCAVFGVKPTGYAMALAAESAELDRERVRIWYVAATRARELLLLPRLDVTPKGSVWNAILDLSLASLPAINLSGFAPGVVIDADEKPNTQTREIFAEEAAGIAARQQHIRWRAPSREEGVGANAFHPEEPEILISDIESARLATDTTPGIQGGRERGVVLHKLIEEVLTGETEESVPALTARAETLIRALGRPVAHDPASGLMPAELAGCVIRALSAPEVAALRPRLMPEIPVYASTALQNHEEATAGVADAIAVCPAGKPLVVIDWKSDVAPTTEMLEHYRSQVRAYLDITDTERGLIVLATTGRVISVARESRP